ncbi:MAG: hypothetical protein ACKOAQ_03415, partial [Acidimicrobiaceae bacterium]
MATSIATSPRLPDYKNRCITGIIPALLGPQGTKEIPDWMPSCVKGARQVVLLVIDVTLARDKLGGVQVIVERILVWFFHKNGILDEL